jgi:hypothetical protein
MKNGTLSFVRMTLVVTVFLIFNEKKLKKSYNVVKKLSIFFVIKKFHHSSNKSIDLKQIDQSRTWLP